MLAAAHDLLQPLPLLISQPPRPQRFRHPPSSSRSNDDGIESGTNATQGLSANLANV